MFKPKEWRSPLRQSDQAYDKLRGSSSARGYDWRWSKAARQHLSANPLCVGCLARGRPVAAVLVDHQVPHKGDMALFWDQSKWQSLCKWDHDVVKQKLETMFARGLISVADLRLDSAVAIRIAKIEDPSAVVE